MERPYMICHMMMALNGKITGPFLYAEETKTVIDEYDRIHESFGAKAWMCGRKTMEENFTMGESPKLEPVTGKIPRVDFIAKETAGVYCLSVDPSGRLGWPANYIEAYNGRSKAHVVEILTEQVSDEYLGFLRRMGISYLFGGNSKLELDVVLEKIKMKLGVDCMLLEGGGSLNGSFLKAGLIDEMSLLLAPVVDGEKDTPCLFDGGDAMMAFDLQQVEPIGKNGLWMRYKSNAL